MTKLEPDRDYTCSAYFNDGEVVKIFAPKLVNSQLHKFEGWSCEAGYSTLYVHADGNVFGGECENDFLGNLNDKTFNLLDQPTTCKQNFCTNNNYELSTTKFKPL
jgi:hypothetical protein